MQFPDARSEKLPTWTTVSRSLGCKIIRSTSPEKLNLLHAIKTPSARIAVKLEKLLQKRFAHKKSFAYSDEWLDLDESDTNWFCNLTYESLKETLPESTRQDIIRLEEIILET